MFLSYTKFQKALLTFPLDMKINCFAPSAFAFLRFLRSDRIGTPSDFSLPPTFSFRPCPIHSCSSLVSVKKGPTPTGRSPLFVQTNRVLKFAFTPRDDFAPQSAVGSAPRSTAFLPRFRPPPATGSTERLSPPRSRLCRELPTHRGNSRLP